MTKNSRFFFILAAGIRQSQAKDIAQEARKQEAGKQEAGKQEAGKQMVALAPPGLARLRPGAPQLYVGSL
jgi:hypothetical protein